MRTHAARPAVRPPNEVSRGMSQPVELSVRQFERTEVVLDAEFELAPECRGQVRFSGRSSASKGTTALRVTVSDVGLGGMGVQVPMFLPRMTVGTIRVFDPAPAGVALSGEPVHAVAFECVLRVRRCELTSRVPTYFVGFSFEKAEADLAAKLGALMERVGTSMRRLALERLERDYGAGLGERERDVA